jgi:hypothetical protein
LVPFTVSVKVAPPAKALAGETEVMVGVGAVMAKLLEFDVAPPGAATATVAVPADVIRLADTGAVS